MNLYILQRFEYQDDYNDQLDGKSAADLCPVCNVRAMAHMCNENVQQDSKPALIIN